MKDFLNLSELFGYWFRRKDSSRPMNASIKAMHWINKISIVVFLIGIIGLAYKLSIR